MQRRRLVSNPERLHIGRVSKRSILLVVFLSIALLLGLLIWLKQLPNPTYKGRSLTEWLDDLEAGPFGTPQVEQQYDAAREALYAIGEAAVPRLLHLMEQRDSKIELALIKLATKQRVIRITFRNEQARHWLADERFSAVREKGESAVPRLIRMIDDQTRDGGPAAAALIYMGQPQRGQPSHR